MDLSKSSLIRNFDHFVDPGFEVHPLSSRSLDHGFGVAVDVAAPAAVQIDAHTLELIVWLVEVQVGTSGHVA